MSLITVSHLSKTYESWKKPPGILGTLKSLVHREKVEVSAVTDISFEIKEGEFVGFIGPNGAGKTTTLKMLSGILWPTSGEAHVMGYVPWERRREFQRQFAIVLGSKNQLWWDLPARDTFLLNKEIYEIPTKEYEKRLSQLGDALSISHLFEIPVRKLSLGERMKCELVNALLHRPRVIFLDEPTIGLDVVSQKTIRDFLRQWNREQGATIVLTSHAMADVEALCERVIVIQGGSIHYDGRLSDLVERVADHKEVVVTLREPVSQAVAEKIAPVANFSPLKIIFHVPRQDVKEVAKTILDRLPVSDLLIEEEPIEEVVRKLFLKT